MTALFQHTTWSKRYLVVWLFLLPFSLYAQEEGPLLRVYDNESYEPLPFATIVSLPDSNIQTTTDEQGRARLPENWGGDDRLLISFLGYEDWVESRSWLELMDYEVVLGQLVYEWTHAAPVVIGRRNQTRWELVQSVNLLEKQALDFVMPMNSADALAEVGGIYVQKSQQGGGSPVLRGFEANRVLLVVDGVRMNNAIFRNGHLQNAITVDPNALEQIEVISGPGSLEYGSDAIGGVVHFRTRKPRYENNFGFRGFQFGTQYSSAAHHQQYRFSFEASGKKVASLSMLSLNRFRDLRAGARRPDAYPAFGLRTHYIERRNGRDSLVTNPNPNRQIASGYDQLDFLHKQRIDLGNSWEAQLNIQYSTSTNIPRYDALIETRDGELRWAEWEYGPQVRLLTSLRLENPNSSVFADYSSLIIARQAVGEDRIQRRVNDPFREISEVDVTQWTAQFDFEKGLGNGQRLGYGFDARTDEVRSIALLEDADRQTGPFVEGPTRYPSRGSRLSSVGAYSDYRLQTDNNWILNAGLRLNRQWLTATFGASDPIEWPENYLEGIRNNQTALTATASLQKTTENNRWRLLWAQAFRAPNIDDFAKFRERNGRIQVPNPDLRPERSNSLEIGWDFSTSAGRFRGWDIQVVAYHSWLQNAIIRTDFQLPDGSGFFVSRGDTLLVQANVNADRARVYGVDLSINRKINQFWSFKTEAHWLRGRRLQTGPAGQLWLPQDHIPPAYGRSQLRYQRGQWLAQLQARYQLRKAIDDYAVSEIILEGEELILDRTGTSDNLELTPTDPNTGEFAGVYGWWTLGFKVEFKATEKWTIHLGVDNILDRHYRTFGSGISAAGRDFRIGISWQAAD